MSNVYEQVIKHSKKIESLLEDRLGTKGRGLHEKTNSVESLIPVDVVKKIRYIASIRNKLMHEDGFIFNDMENYQDQSRFVINTLKDLKTNTDNILNNKQQNQCAKCNQISTPRLYIERATNLYIERKRHICVHCGSDMYYTGGQLNHTIIFIAYLILFIFSSTIPNKSSYIVSAIVIATTIFTGFYYKLKPKGPPFFQVLTGFIVAFSLFGLFIIYGKIQRQTFEYTELFQILFFVLLSIIMLWWYYRYKK